MPDDKRPHNHASRRLACGIMKLIRVICSHVFFPGLARADGCGTDAKAGQWTGGGLRTQNLWHSPAGVQKRKRRAVVFAQSLAAEPSRRAARNRATSESRVDTRW